MLKRNRHRPALKAKVELKSTKSGETVSKSVWVVSHCGPSMESGTALRAHRRL
jgi:hypothetical protein